VDTLETGRLILRPFCMQDLRAFAAYRSDPLVARYQTWEAPYPVEKAREFIEQMSRLETVHPGEWYQLALELKASGEMIGDVAFHRLAEDARQAEIGFTLSRRHQGKGYATEAVTRLLDYLFGELCLHRVRAICDAENEPSRRLLERIGMRREGYFIKSYWLKGRWTSEYWYAILGEEWLKNQHRGSGNVEP